MAVLERGGENIGRRGHGGVEHLHPYPLLRQAAGQNVGGALRVAVNGGVGDHHAAHLRLIAAPKVVLAQNIRQILAPHEAVEGQEHGDVQRRSLLQHRLHLGAVLAHDIRVIAAALVQIVAVKVHLVGKEAAVQRAEAAEGVRRQQEFVRLVIGHHHLRPVDHRRHDELQGVAAGAEGVALLADADAIVIGMAEKLADHGLGHGGAKDLHMGEAQHQILQLGGVVRLHVVHHDVVQGAAIQGVVQIFPELADHLGVHRVKQDGLFVQKQVAVVRHAVWHAEDSLKHGQTPAVGADPCVILVDFSDAVHIVSSRCFKLFLLYCKIFFLYR